MTLEELNVYQLAMSLGERVWAAVAPWDFFAKDTVGKQLVRAADSVAANLSEGFGRFHYKENKQHGPSQTSTDNTFQVNVPDSPCESVQVPVLVVNATLSLINLCCYLLDRQLDALAKSFENEGGFSERLYRVRSARRKNNL